MLQPKKKALFLYFEMAGYFVACLQNLVKQYDVEAHVVRYPVNPVAPFKFDSGDGITYYERKDFDKEQLRALIKSINPDFIYCNGWMDKEYVKVTKQYKGKIPTVLTFDNPWLGTLKQRVASITAPFILPKIFSHCWVPGSPQITYAKKLGFKDSQLFTGMYSADYGLFDGFYKNSIAEKEKKFPHTFLFVGRYTKLKGVKEMWQAFIEFQNETPCDWELLCIGKGEFDNEFPQHPKIKNVGFVQPTELEKYIKQTGVFLLPAYYEHWGVVVHEFAIAGYPLFCSTKTSAATTFLKDGINGFVHEPCSADAIKETFKKFTQLSDEKLIDMAHQSHQLSKIISPDTWSKTVWDFVKMEIVSSN
jgi:glycosyltransferase involved in cell wall biosynthesis